MLVAWLKLHKEATFFFVFLYPENTHPSVPGFSSSNSKTYIAEMEMSRMLAACRLGLEEVAV